MYRQNASARYQRDRHGSGRCPTSSMSQDSQPQLDAADDEPLSPAASENGDNEPVTHEEYSARMEEIMDDSDDAAGSEDGFIYDGVDAPKLDYKDQLREALSDDGADDEVIQDELQVEHIVGNGSVPPALVVDDDVASNQVRRVPCLPPFHSRA